MLLAKGEFGICENDTTFLLSKASQREGSGTSPSFVGVDKVKSEGKSKVKTISYRNRQSVDV